MRYPLRLPVSLKLANSVMRAWSQNISLKGILLSTKFLVPEGYAVELVVETESSFVLTGSGKVLRVHPQELGGFAIAVGCDRPFHIARQQSTASY